MSEHRAWVRLVDGQFVVTWQVGDGRGGWRRGGTRPLTFAERVAWQVAGKVPEIVKQDEDDE